MLSTGTGASSPFRRYKGERMRKLSTWAALVAVLLTMVLTSTSPAGAASADIAIDGTRVALPADLGNPVDIEQFLVRVGSIQHSTSTAFLAQAPPVLRAAVLA